MFKKLLIAIVALGCLEFAGFGALAWRPAIAPVALPAGGSFAPELIARAKHSQAGAIVDSTMTASGAPCCS